MTHLLQSWILQLLHLCQWVPPLEPLFPDLGAVQLCIRPMGPQTGGRECASIGERGETGVHTGVRPLMIPLLHLANSRLGRMERGACSRVQGCCGEILVRSCSTVQGLSLSSLEALIPGNWGNKEFPSVCQRNKELRTEPSRLLRCWLLIKGLQFSLFIALCTLRTSNVTSYCGRVNSPELKAEARLL